MAHVRREARLTLTESPSPGATLQLNLQVQINPDNPDWPRLTVHTDGINPFEQVAPEWQGFDPDEMLGKRSPLLPAGPWRRVAVARCSCGIEGCGVIAPLVSERDGIITWSDFRDYTGVFTGPTPPDDADQLGGGRPWLLPDLRFSATQYRKEVRRASSDRGWETTRRAAARLLRPYIARHIADNPSDVSRFNLAPAWKAPGLSLTLTHAGSRQRDTWWEYLSIPTPCVDPAAEAAELAHQLHADGLQQWSFRYAHDPSSE